MRNSQKDNIARIADRVVLIGLVVGALYWILESAVYAFLFHEGTFIEQLFSPTQYEAWMRFIFVIIFFMVTLLAQNIIAKRNKAQEEMRASENKYRTLLENLPQKIFLKDKNSIYVSCNENYARDLKTKPEEIAGKTDYEFHPRELAEKYRADDKRVMESGETEDIEERYIQDGQDMYVHTVKTPIRDEQGNVIGILGIFWDITQHKRVNEALQESEEKYRTLIENASDFIFMIDEKGKVLSLNKSAAMLFRKKSEEIIGKSIFDLFPYEVAINFSESLKDIFQTGESQSSEGKMIVGKMEMWISTNLNPLRNREGKIAAVMGVSRDITGRKHTEKALLESEERYRALFEGSPEGILVADVETMKFKYANPAICRMLGYPEEELKKMSLADIHPKEDLKYVISEFEAQARGAKTLAPNIPCLKKDGTVIYVDISTARVILDGKECNVGFFKDITEHRKAEEEIKNKNQQLQRINKELEDFTYIVSHDLKSPLVNLQGFSAKLSEICGETRKELNDLSGLCQELNLNQAKQKVKKVLKNLENNVPLSLQFIKASISKMDSLIKSLLDLSRISTRRKPLELVDLNSMLKDVINSQEYQIQEKNIQLNVMNLPEVLCEKEKINQVFSNLLSNAINYIGENPDPQIEVGYQDKGDRLQFHVKDNGIGIDKKNFDKIFQLFKRVGDVDVKGDGMGLAYVKKIIQQHQGEIWVESEKGKGSTFYFTLPKKEGKQDVPEEICEYTHSGG